MFAPASTADLSASDRLGWRIVTRELIPMSTRTPADADSFRFGLRDRFASLGVDAMNSVGTR
jgi:hypothetical protein